MTEFGESLDPATCDVCEERPHVTSRTEGGSLPTFMLCQPCADEWDRDMVEEPA